MAFYLYLFFSRHFEGAGEGGLALSGHVATAIHLGSDYLSKVASAPVNSPDLRRNEGRVHGKVSIISRSGAVNWSSLPQSCCKLKWKIGGDQREAISSCDHFCQIASDSDLVPCMISINQIWLERLYCCGKLFVKPGFLRIYYLNPPECSRV